MSEEKRIFEILAEYLQKTDRALEHLDKTLDELRIQREINERHVSALEKQTDILFMHSTQLGKHDDEILKIHQENQRIFEKLDFNETKNQELLNELLSISRRVGNIEDSKR